MHHGQDSPQSSIANTLQTQSNVEIEKPVMTMDELKEKYAEVQSRLYPMQREAVAGRFATDDASKVWDFIALLLKDFNVPEMEYETLPYFTEKHKSLMSKLLTKELFFELKASGATAKGYSISRAIQTGVMTPHLGVGITAGDEESWVKFSKIMNPVIKGWHDFDPETQSHRSDRDPEKLVMTAEQLSLFSEHVASTRIRAARNISGYALPAGATDEDRRAVRVALTRAFERFEGELAGTYYDLAKLSDVERDHLQSKGYLFQIPGTRNLLWHAGAARQWPEDRGIFHNEALTALCWVNEEDHCRIISMEQGGDVKSVFKRFCAMSDALEASAEQDGMSFMYSEKLGFLGTCPSNLGTSLRASVMMKLPKFNETSESRQLLSSLCAKFDLQPRGSSGEHSASLHDTFDLSNKKRIGFTEVQLVQKMIDGVTSVIHYEQALAAGEKDLEAIKVELEGFKGLGFV